MPFHLILPGLLWPQKALRDTVHDLPLPNLSWLLGRGTLRWQDPLPVEHWLCRELACASHPQHVPAAALRLLGEGGTPDGDLWLCADPVHLRIDQGRAHLFGGSLDITRDEMQQLGDALRPHFADVGDYHVGTSGHGYLRLRKAPRLVTTPPSAAAGRGNLLPSGEDASQWLRLVNEAQMLLHALPLNARREDEGRPRLNSVWLWGAGSLPPPLVAAGEYEQLLGNHPMLKGLAAWAGIAHHPAPDAPALPAPRGTLLMLDDLQQASQTLDAGNWRAALLAIDTGWLNTLGKSLRSGRLGSLRLTALGDEAALDITLKRSDALKFWRRPRPIHQLAFPG